MAPTILDDHMVHQLKTAPHHWKKGSHPYPCDTRAKLLPQPRWPKLDEDAPVYNVLYLVDEHDISGNINQQVTRKGRTLAKRYAWHYQVADLETFNVGQPPDTIQLHEKIGNPLDNDVFQWEGFMFGESQFELLASPAALNKAITLTSMSPRKTDIPGGKATCRVSIVAGADLASPSTLTGPAAPDGSSIDRIVGFAGIYPDNRVPYGPIVQVRRDDAYRRLGASLKGDVQVAWHCAYYITKDTPKMPTPHVRNMTNGDHVRGVNGKGAEKKSSYDQFLGQTVDDEVVVGSNGRPWGGMVFGFTLSDTIPRADPRDDSALEPYDYSAIMELGIEF